MIILKQSDNRTIGQSDNRTIGQSDTCEASRVANQTKPTPDFTDEVSSAASLTGAADRRRQPRSESKSKANLKNNEINSTHGPRHFFRLLRAINR